MYIHTYIQTHTHTDKHTDKHTHTHTHTHTNIYILLGCITVLNELDELAQVEIVDSLIICQLYFTV